MVETTKFTVRTYTAEEDGIQVTVQIEPEPAITIECVGGEKVTLSLTRYEIMTALFGQCLTEAQKEGIPPTEHKRRWPWQKK